MLDADGHYVYEPLTHMLNMIEAHAMQQRDDYWWAGGGPTGKPADWDEIRRIIADHVFDATGLRETPTNR